MIFSKLVVRYLFGKEGGEIIVKSLSIRGRERQTLSYSFLKEMIFEWAPHLQARGPRGDGRALAVGQRDAGEGRPVVRGRVFEDVIIKPPKVFFIVSLCLNIKKNNKKTLYLWPTPEPLGLVKEPFFWLFPNEID